MKLLNKIRSLPEKKKKTMLWIIMVFVIIIVAFFHVENLRGIFKADYNLGELFFMEEVKEVFDQSKEILLNQF